MSTKKLTMTVGLPRSGKSTWARTQGIPIVCPDAIRLGLHGKAWEALAEGFVWAIAKVMVRALFIAGHDEVILDSTCLTKARRADWKSSDWQRDYVVFHTSKEECVQRALDTNQEYLLPVIEKMDQEREEISEEDLDGV